MEKNREAVFQELNSLAEGFSHLGSRLSKAVSELQTPDVSLSGGLTEEITASCQDFAAPCSRALELAESLIDPLLRVVAEAEEKRESVEKVRQNALWVLDQVLAIVHRDQPDFPPLSACQTQARELRQAVVEAPRPDLDPDIRALAEGNHHFSALLILVANLEELEDERWESLREQVTQSLGHSLALAASRGKLMLLEDSSPEEKASFFEEAEL